MRRFLTLSIITFGLSFSLSAQEHTQPQPRSTPGSTHSNVVDTGGWAGFASETGRFSVLMPETPVEKPPTTTQSEHGPYTLHMFVARDTTSVYIIGWVDYAPEFNFNRQAELEANRDNFIKGVKAKLVTTRSTTIDGYSALEFVAETVDRTFKSRVYIVGRRPYQIVIGSPKGHDDSVNANRFFNSFKIRMR
ncbi:MAG TPA: hypothetical protein VF074_10415 [Pyrinomonadaceae bacterium]